MVQGDAHTIIRNPEGISIDDCDQHRFGNCQLGDLREVNGRRALVVGMTVSGGQEGNIHAPVPSKSDTSCGSPIGTRT
jgi:hypothetical protein